ncbi:CaiB/BaiF CoA transferase family protein [Marinibaculum pumilum]|uniref:CaiB/BaiF CoA transferase family protein n=1 Tax=Marinibaculum pumilum TaxID=1766165 RepID=A0ABV7L6Y2_9PROT
MGPLSGVKVVEFAGIGPGPFCGMLLADQGADVLRIDRTAAADLGVPVDPRFDVLGRGRRSVALDLKKPEAIETALQLIAKADAVIEGFRPGVMERLGLGPEICLERNPKLVFGRMTGWGQEGPMAHAAGHDINYISLTGALHAVGPKDRPYPPLNLVGDFGGGALYLAFGVCAALIEARASGKGQVVDAAMVDGAASLMTPIYGLKAAGRWADERGVNILDGGAPWYDVYETKDGKFISIGSIEKKFYAELIEKLGLGDANLPAQFDMEQWPALRKHFAAAFKEKTRDEWCAIMEGSDICFAPVLSMEEAPEHGHMKARGTFVEVDGITQPGPAPRFSRTPGGIRHRAPKPGEGADATLKDWGFADDQVAAMRNAGVLG